MPKSIDSETLIRMFEERGYTLIDREYINAHTYHNYICNKHEDFGIQTVRYCSFKRGSGCKECRNEERRGKPRNKVTIKMIEEKFYENGLKLVEGQSYKNRLEPLYFVCLSHIDKGVQSKSWSNFRSSIKSSNGCHYCGIESRSVVFKKDFQDIVDYVEDAGFQMVSDGSDYKNQKSKLTMVCPFHGEFKMSWSNFYTRKRCQKCGHELNSGEKHSNWQGGITELGEYLRHKITGWKLESMKYSNYKCVITGDNFDHIHHLVNFNYIMKESLKTLDISVRENISHYSQEELNRIEEEVEKIHSNYPLGVCLRKDIHFLFHSIYGRTENSIEQFEEFKELYQKGKIKESVT